MPALLKPIRQSFYPHENELPDPSGTCAPSLLGRSSVARPRTHIPRAAPGRLAIAAGRPRPARPTQDAELPYDENSSAGYALESVDEWIEDGEMEDGCGFGGCRTACCPDRCGRCMSWEPVRQRLRASALVAAQRRAALMAKGTRPAATSHDERHRRAAPGTDRACSAAGPRPAAPGSGAASISAPGSLATSASASAAGFWGLDDDDSTFAISSTDLPNQTIERPFIQSPSTPNSLVIADPFTGFDGNISVATALGGFGARRLRPHPLPSKAASRGPTSSPAISSPASTSRSRNPSPTRKTAP